MWKMKIKEGPNENIKKKLNRNLEIMIIYDSYRKDINFLISCAAMNRNFIPQWNMFCMNKIENEGVLFEEYEDKNEVTELFNELKNELNNLCQVLFQTSLF